MREDTQMNNKAFDEFVARQQEAGAEATLNWERERDEWLAQLNRLYSWIESLLRKYVSSGQIRLEYRPMQLNEEGIGSYSARKMILRIGPQEVALMPIGTRFIGYKGRVDVVGPAGEGELLLVDRSKESLRQSIQVKVVFGVEGKLPILPEQPQRQIDWEWRIVTRPPERRFIEITQENLFQLIMEVANG